MAGNALLGKSAMLAQRHYQARSEGWLAELMLIMGVQIRPAKMHYVAAAFPLRAARPTSLCAAPRNHAGWKFGPSATMFAG